MLYWNMLLASLALTTSDCVVSDSLGPTVVIKNTDMNEDMQQHVVTFVSQHVDDPDLPQLVCAEFDTSYNVGWECIVGATAPTKTSVRHVVGTFILLYVKNTTLMLWKV